MPNLSRYPLIRTRVPPQILLVCTIALCGLISKSHAELSPAELENTKSLEAVTYNGRRAPTGEAPIHWVPRAIRKTYEIPICFEADAQLGRAAEESFIPFEIQRNETLKSALNEFTLLTNGVYQWTWFGNILFVGPLDADNTRAPGNLDTIISLELNGASVWDAFVQLAEAVRLNSTSEYPLRGVSPANLMGIDAPPEELLEEGHVSLSLSNVSAREAACAIVSASPIEMYFSLVTGPDADDVFLYFTEDGKITSTRRMTDEEVDAWKTEVLSVRARLESLSPE